MAAKMDDEVVDTLVGEPADWQHAAATMAIQISPSLGLAQRRMMLQSSATYSSPKMAMYRHFLASI